MSKDEIVAQVDTLFRLQIQRFVETREELPKALFVLENRIDMAGIDKAFFNTEAAKDQLRSYLHTRFQSLRPHVEGAALFLYNWAYGYELTEQGAKKKQMADALGLSNREAWKAGLCSRQEMFLCLLEGPGWRYDVAQFYHTRSDGAIILKEFVEQAAFRRLGSRFCGFWDNCDTEKHGQSNAHSA
jgi:hypothetical protein